MTVSSCEFFGELVPSALSVCDMNTLTGIEAERVNQILRHGIDRLNILASIPHTWDDELLDAIDHDIVHTSIQKLWTYEKNLSPFEDEIHAGGEDFAIIKRTHKAIRNVCRSIQSDKDVLFQIVTSANKSKDIEDFVKCLNDLRNIILSRMTTTVEDEAAHRTLLHELTERERHYEESRDALQRKLNEVIDEKEKVTASLDQTLRKLQAEIQDITQVRSSAFLHL
jgi:vacuolar-type H+-ATPase subunit I/STV1